MKYKLTLISLILSVCVAIATMEVSFELSEIIYLELCIVIFRSIKRHFVGFPKHFLKYRPLVLALYIC